jgi:hypothetical protein
MESTSRQHEVYGGENAPTGLCMFAWWKKNGKKRLQKLGSGSAQIRSSSDGRHTLLPFYRHLRLDTGARSCGPFLCHARQAEVTDPGKDRIAASGERPRAVGTPAGRTSSTKPSSS